MNSRLSALLSARLLDRANGHRQRVLELFSQRQRTDYLSRDNLDQFQSESLAGLLHDARSYVPRIRSLLANHPAITADNARKALASLPAMRRAGIQADPASFIAEGASGLVDDFTGGSSGTPLCFKVDRATQQAREASLYWANSLSGWNYGERISMLWGSDRDSSAALRDLRVEARWWLDNMRWHNAFKMDDARMAHYHREMLRFRPHLVVAYAGSIFTFARFLEAHGLTPSYPSKGIVSSAEVLTAPMREAVERVFKVPVFDRYGNREAGAIAAECEAHSGLHINEADFIVEIDSRDPEKEPGPLLITYLSNRAMPLIRYDTGDLATWQRGTCSCGRNSLRLARVVGRQSDTLRMPSGNLVHGEYFTHVLYGATGVREFQFVQEDLTHYRLLVVAAEKKPDDEARWREKIRNVLDSDAILTIEYVQEIPVLPSGKRRFTLSKLPS